MTETGDRLKRLRSLQSLVALAYAISLPLSMTASWVLLTAGILLWLGETVISPGGGTDRDESESTFIQRFPLAPPLVLFACGVAISGLFNGTAMPGSLSAKGIREAALSIWSLKGIAIYFWGRHLFRTDRELAMQCLLSVLCVSAVAGIWGTIQQVFNFHPFGYRWLQGTGFLGGPMPFAGQMQIFSMLALGLLLTRAYAKRGAVLSNPAIFFTITVANILGLVFAGERSAWLGGLAGVLVLTAFLSWRTFVKCAVILIVIGAVSWLTVPLVHTRIESMFSGKQDVSTRVRWQVWNLAISQWRLSPIVGIGFLHFPHLDIPEAIVPGKSKDLNHAHSNYLQILSTTGLVGFAAYLIMCMAILALCIKQIRLSAAQRDCRDFALGTGTVAAMVSLMVSGLFEYNFGTAQVRLVQWFILSLLPK